MVYIVTGGIDSGKTTKLQSMYRAERAGDGFICAKVLGAEGTDGYDLVRLSTEERVPFIREKRCVPDDWKEAFAYRRFSFSADGLGFAERIIHELVNRCVSPIIIDEIGPVELAGGGFAKLFRSALACGDVYIAVREACVNDVIEVFNIWEYQRVSV